MKERITIYRLRETEEFAFIDVSPEQLNILTGEKNEQYYLLLEELAEGKRFLRK